jgi:uncharacterized protein YijF (DUF1287 family)
LSDGGVRFLLLLPALVVPALAAPPADFLLAARSQIGMTIRYDSAYTVLNYPGGDVPIDRGVCTDVIVRAMRKTGIDLQKAIHEDMKRSFSAYPKLWGLSAPDRNIDHRRVPNLERYFERQGKKLPVTSAAAEYRPGDIVTCIVPPHMPHIMIVSDRVSAEDPTRPLIIHNIGGGTQEEDRLFEFKLTGHYRWW